MQVKSITKYQKVSPRKLRLIAKAVSGQEAQRVLERLVFLNKAAGGILAKAIKSALFNARNNSRFEGKLQVKKIEVNNGPTLKRGRPVARGAYHRINKRTSHVIITLEG